MPIVREVTQARLVELEDQWRTAPPPRRRKAPRGKREHWSVCSCPPSRWSPTAEGQLAHAASHLPPRYAAVLYWMSERPAEVLTYEDFNVQYFPDKIGGPFIVKTAHVSSAVSVIRRALYAYAPDWRAISRWRKGYELVRIHR